MKKFPKMSRTFQWKGTLIVSRFTLFNARRGEEASRMLRTEWEDAERNVWVPQEQVANVEDSAEKFLVVQFQLADLKGKGKKFVPVLVPKDLVPGIRLLIENRTLYGIPVNNPFLFGTKSEKSHCSVWHASMPPGRYQLDYSWKNETSPLIYLPPYAAPQSGNLS